MPVGKVTGVSNPKKVTGIESPANVMGVQNFLPTDIAGLKWWIDPQDESTLDSPDGLTYSVDDKSGNAEVVSCQTGKPLGICASPQNNSKRLLRVVGNAAANVAGGSVSIDAIADEFQSAFTLIFTGGPHVTTSAGGQWAIGAGNSATANTLMLFGTSSSKYSCLMRNDAGTLRSLASVADADNSLAVFYIQWNGTTLSFGKRGAGEAAKAQLGTGAFSGTCTFDRFSLGVSPRNTGVFASPSDCLFGGLLLYDTAISGTDLDKAIAYLYARDGIAAIANELAFSSDMTKPKQPKLYRASDTGGVSGVATSHLSLSKGRYSGSSGLYYVDWANGNDGNAGTIGSPLKTIDVALAKTDVCGVVLADGVHRGATWTDGYTEPERSVSVYAENMAVICNAEEDITWSLTTSQTNTYEITRTAATTRVIDMADLDAKGIPQTLTSRASIALVEANPGSYFSDVITGKVYVHTQDSRIPDDDILVQKGTIKPAPPFTGTNRFMHLENITFINVADTTKDINIIDKTNCCYYYLNVHSFYSQAWFHGAATEVYRKNCSGFRTEQDIWSYGGTVIAVEDGCIGSESGTGFDNANCTTNHESGISIRINGDYSEAPRVAHDIDTSINDYIRCAIYDAVTSTETGTDDNIGLIAGLNGSQHATKTRAYWCTFGGNSDVDVQCNGSAVINMYGTTSGDITSEVNGSPVGVINFL